MPDVMVVPAKKGKQIVVLSVLPLKVVYQGYQAGVDADCTAPSLHCTTLPCPVTSRSEPVSHPCSGEGAQPRQLGGTPVVPHSKMANIASASAQRRSDLFQLSTREE